MFNFHRNYLTVSKFYFTNNDIIVMFIFWPNYSTVNKWHTITSNSQ